MVHFSNKNNLSLPLEERKKKEWDSRWPNTERDGRARLVWGMGHLCCVDKCNSSGIIFFFFFFWKGRVTKQTNLKPDPQSWWEIYYLSDISLFLFLTSSFQRDLTSWKGFQNCIKEARVKSTWERLMGAVYSFSPPQTVRCAKILVPFQFCCCFFF